MPENDVPKSGMSLLERARKKLTPDARTRFILLFALFNAMFCLVVLLSLRNMELVAQQESLEGEIKRLKQVQETVGAGVRETVMAGAATQIAGVRETVAAEAATQIAELKAALFQAPTPVPPTVYPTYTLNPTYTSVPTDTPIPPTPTPLPPSPTTTPVPPTPTPLPPSPTTTPVPPTPTPLPPSPTATPVPPAPTDTPVRPTPTPPPPTPTPTDTPTPTNTPTPTDTPMPTDTPTSLAPIVYSISPDNGDTKSIVPITNLAGEYFLPEATARISNGIIIDLTSVTVISPTHITGTLDLSVAAGGPWDVQVTNPDLQSDTATNAFTVTIPITYSYPITSTCNISVTNCLSGTGAPDRGAANIDEGGVITLDFGTGNGIMDGRGYDLVFYEWYNDDCTCIELDWIKIELAEDGLTQWYTAFNWEDGYHSPIDDSTNITAFSNDADGEVDNEVITSTLLYDWPNDPPSGILIDINFLPDRPEAQYRYVRLSCPDDGSGNDAAQVDSIERLH